MLLNKTENYSDAQLVISYQSGDQVALAALVKRWHLDFCRKANSLLKDPDLSKDIAQECWNTIMLKIHDLNEPEKFAGWAMRIVYSKSLDALRRITRDRLKKEKYSIESNVEQLEVESDNEAIKRDLLLEIKKLPVHQQHVIKLFYVEDYSLKEISNILHISIGTAKSRLFHAREKLKQQLKHRNYEK